MRDAPYDPEFFAVATVLHDLDWKKHSTAFSDSKGECACPARIRTRGGHGEHRAQLIWDGVSLNSTPSIALYKETRSLCAQPASVSIGVDRATELLTQSQISTILEAFRGSR